MTVSSISTQFKIALGPALSKFHIISPELPSSKEQVPMFITTAVLILALDLILSTLSISMSKFWSNNKDLSTTQFGTHKTGNSTMHQLVQQTFHPTCFIFNPGWRLHVDTIIWVHLWPYASIPPSMQTPSNAYLHTPAMSSSSCVSTPAPALSICDSEISKLLPSSHPSHNPAHTATLSSHAACSSHICLGPSHCSCQHWYQFVLMNFYTKYQCIWYCSDTLHLLEWKNHMFPAKQDLTASPTSPMSLAFDSLPSSTPGLFSFGSIPCTEWATAGSTAISTVYLRYECDASPTITKGVCHLPDTLQTAVLLPLASQQTLSLQPPPHAQPPWPSHMDSSLHLRTGLISRMQPNWRSAWASLTHLAFQWVSMRYTKSIARVFMHFQKVCSCIGVMISDLAVFNFISYYTTCPIGCHLHGWHLFTYYSSWQSHDSTCPFITGPHHHS